jgi:hypothetical protein
VSAYGGSVGVRRGDVGSIFWFELPRSHAVEVEGSPEPAPLAH